MPELATITNQLFNEIDRIRLIPKIDEFTLIRLEREAQKLLNVDAFHAYQLFGFLASFRGHIIDVHKNYEKALKSALTNSDKSIVLSNYAMSLSDMGFFSDALNLNEKAYNYEQSIENIKLIIARSSVLGLFSNVINIIQKHNLNLKEFSFIWQVKYLMDKYGVKDKELQKLIEIGISILHKHQFFDFRNSTKFEFTEDEYSKWLCFVIKIDRSVDEIVEMKYELACALAESDLPTELLLNFIVAYEIAGE